MKRTKKTQISATIDPKFLPKLNAIAHIAGRSFSAIVNDAIGAYLRKQKPTSEETAQE